MKQLPSIFCWSKMGAEAGEDLSAILRRKEWERQLERGQFYWGIGQSLGTQAECVDSEAIPFWAIFSPMSSKPKTIDVAPSDVVLWNAWIDDRGMTHSLPKYSFVTSRASLPSGRRKEVHYALVCTSSDPLSHAKRWTVAPSRLRNVATNRPLGASQVTAIVRMADATAISPEEKTYPVMFAAALCRPYYVRLAQPSLLREHDLERIAAITSTNDFGKWIALVEELRSNPRAPIDPAMHATVSGLAI